MALKICLLAPATSIHTQRWCISLADAGLEVTLLTMHGQRDLGLPQKVKVIELPFSSPLGIVLNVRKVRQILDDLDVDILHSHYASSYGTLGSLSGFKPYVISVWGSDIYDFPLKSFFHRRLVNWNLRNADRVTSTSQAMARATKLIAPGAHSRLKVIPFGVDTDIFYPEKSKGSKELIKLGTVKALSSKYGIDRMIKSFVRLRNSLSVHDKRVANSLELHIYGRGPDETSLRSLIHSLGVEDFVHLHGHLPHHQVPDRLREMDIFINLSREESFGVAVIEASSCGLPVVVSNVGGLPEVVIDGVTGFILEGGDIHKVADVLEQIIKNPELSLAMGAAGRQYVIKNYEWSQNVSQMIALYQELSGKHSFN